MIKKIEFFTNDKIKLSIRLIFVFTFIGSLLELISLASLPIFLNFIINYNEVINFINSNFPISIFETFEFEDFVFFSLISIISLFIFKNLYLIFLTYYQGKTFENFAVYNATFFYNNYLLQRVSFFVDNNPSKLIRNVSQEIFALSKILQHLSYIFSDILILLLLTSILLLNSPLFTLITLAVIIFLFSLYFSLIKKNILKKGKELLEFRGLVIKILTEDFNLISQIKISKTENFFKIRFRNEYEKYEKNKFVFFVLQLLPKYIFETLLVSIFVSFFYFVLKSGGINDIIKLIPDITLFVLAAIKIFPAIARINQYFNSINLNYPSLDALTKEKKNILNNIDNFKLNNIQKIQLNDEIKFQGVSFNYENLKKSAIRNINLTIKLNSTTAFIGKSGAGKSTIVNLILGLLKPSSGKILIDNKDFTSEPYMFSKIGLISQDIYLADDTILSNITLGKLSKDIDMKKIYELVKSCELETLIKRNNLGLNTIVGSRGMTVSGGEKQKIALARALYNNPDIIVLDEPTSSLDNKSEKEFLKILKNFRGNKTIILISHRMSVLDDDTYVYLIDEGKIKYNGIFLNLKKNLSTIE